MQTPSNRVIQTKGSIDIVTLSRDNLEISGWVTSPDYGFAEKFVIYLNGKMYSVFECSTGLPSPDVKAFYPELTSAGNCRFFLRVPLSPLDAEKVNSSIVLVSPIIRGMHCHILAGMTEENSFHLPPEEDIEFIGGNFEICLEFLTYFINYADLRSTENVLDIGCGFGRMAYPLTAYLSKTAFYEGFDIFERGINWNKKHISSLYPNFNFQSVDILNMLYNPRGIISPTEFQFPYEDRKFDFVILSSVFTHMYRNDVKHYLKEIFRVLKKGGRCFISCFLINTESRRLIEKGNSSQDFMNELEDCYTTDNEIPENAIAYDENMLIKLIQSEQFGLQSKFYGNWCGREQSTSYQDIIIYNFS
jgi:ubiquinone/menaquinone biosynthesis C-methylase UbiE